MQLYSTFFRSKAELRIEPISSTYSYSSSAAQQQRQSISHRCNEEGRVAASRSQSRRRRRRGIHANCYLLFPARVQFEQLALKIRSVCLSVCLPLSPSSLSRFPAYINGHIILFRHWSQSSSSTAILYQMRRLLNFDETKRKTFRVASAQCPVRRRRDGLRL